MDQATASIQELLAQCQGASQKVADQVDYKPPPGVGSASVGKPSFRTFTGKQDQQTYGIVNLPLDIIDGPGKGNLWNLSLYGNSKMDQKTLAAIYCLVTGESDAPPLYSDRVKGIVAHAENKVLAFNVTQSPKKDTPGEFWTNVKFTGTI